MEKKSKSWLIRLLAAIKILLSLIFAVVAALIRSLTIDLFRNIKLYIMMSVSKEEREKIRLKLETEKRLDLIEDKLKSIERLLYAVFKDPKYIEKREGEYDLKQIAKDVKK
ncbi:MAG: hypothetical protein ABIB71_08515 [Candidatus Woesearchaeota archaeon]